VPMPDPMSERHIEDDIAHADGQEVSELIGVVGNIFGRFKRSPPAGLAASVRHWRGLTVGEVVTLVEKFLDENRDRFPGGSGERMLAPLEAALREALAKKRGPAPPRKPARAEPPPPRRRVVEVHTASGMPDLIIDDPAAPVPRSGPMPAPAGRPGALAGYEEGGTAIGGDDPPEAA
jgi:hypothetical protein